MQVSINNVNIDQTCNRYFLTNVKQSILSIDTECSNHDQLLCDLEVLAFWVLSSCLENSRIFMVLKCKDFAKWKINILLDDIFSV